MKALAPVRVTAPATPLLTLEQARAHLRVTHTDEDDYIEALIAAATSHIDGYSGVLGRALITQTWSQSFSRFPGPSFLRLALGKLASIVSVEYYDLSDVEQTFSASAYYGITDAIGPGVQLKQGSSWPGTYDRLDAVTVTWTCGYGSAASDVPDGIIHAAKLLVGHWYHSREAASAGGMNEVPLAVSALLAPFRALSI